MSKTVCVVLKADPVIGTGHLMRVKGLLPALSDAGFRLVLISDSLHQSLMPLCDEYELVEVRHTDELAWGVNGFSPALTIFDHYFVGAETEAQIRSKVAVIDDLKRDHVCSLLTDSCFFTTAEHYRAHVPGDCRLLVGAAYSLIRPEFIDIKREQRLRPRVLINYGGADPAHACLKALNSVLRAGLTAEFDFTVLAGISNPDWDALARIVATHPEIELIRNTSEVGALFARCDLAMGAYGGMMKERMCAGLPCLGTVIASNQRGAPGVIERLDAGLDIALDDLEDPHKVADKLYELNAHRERFVKNGLEAVSGDGIKLVSQALLELADGK